METIKIYIKIYTANMENVSDNVKNILHEKEFEYWHYYYNQTNLVFNSIKQKMKMELDLDPNMYDFYFNNLNESPSSFNIENTNLLYQEFSPIQNGKINFYIRIEKNFISKLLQHLNLIREEQTQEEEEEEICPVCWETSRNNILLTQYTCSHIICSSCYTNCINHQRYNCSLCRAPTIITYV
jgi:formate dehydrogenase maturation protein FdhE